MTRCCHSISGDSCCSCRVRTQVTASGGRQHTVTPSTTSPAVTSTSMTTYSHQSQALQGRRRAVPVNLIHRTGTATAATGSGTGDTTGTTTLLLTSWKGQHSGVLAVTKQLRLQVWLQMALQLWCSR